MACCAHALSRPVPVSVTATSSRSTWAQHSALAGVGFPGDLQGEVLELGEQGAEFLRVLEQGLVLCELAGGWVLVLPAILRVHSA
jgi:hypothetical protein